MTGSEGNLRKLWEELHGEIRSKDAGELGNAIDAFERKHRLTAVQWAEIYVILDNPNQIGMELTLRLRDRLRVLIDNKLAQEQITVQRELAASNDRLGTKMLFAAWAGVAVALVGVVATIVQLVKG